MTLIQPIAFESGLNKHARVYLVNGFENPLHCSKYFLAEGLFENADLYKKPEITEVVCASVGNFGVSVAYLAARHRIHATIYLPKLVPKRTIQLMEVLGASVNQTNYEKLSEEVSLCAEDYAQKHDSRFLLNQFNLDICSKIYLQRIFASLNPLLPLNGIARPIRLFLPWGTGSLFMAGASFIQQIPSKEPHEIVPVNPWPINENDKETCAGLVRKCSNVRLFPPEETDWSETIEMLQNISPRASLPFGHVSSGTLAAAHRHLCTIDPNQEIDLVPVLTDGFLASCFGD